MSNDKKIEMVNKVTLDLTYYSGDDRYSDGGAVEELIYDLVKNNTEDKYNNLIARNQHWPVLYHLSHIRGNLVDFIKLRPEDKVLEIGSGCGAITQALAKSGASITCVELSKQRSLINAARNSDKDNVTIMVGNYEDVEKNLPCDYDYVFMIGVLEYGAAYMSSKDPYMDFLKSAYRHLNQNGCVYLAIENKYGMKYFAGAREDHTGRFYEGIEGYRDNNGARTFSIRQLKSMAKKAGFATEGYYPYPDYKLPVTIYSDHRMPREGELRSDVLNFDNTRVVGFDEGLAFDEVISEGEFERFSNSYLLKLIKGVAPESFSKRSVIYSRHSNDRRDELKIRTDIEEDGYKKLYVCKRPCLEAANEHIQRMVEYSAKLSEYLEGSAFSVNKCVLTENEISAEFEYVVGDTLQEKLDGYFDVLSGKELEEKVFDLLDEYVKDIASINTIDHFDISDGFKKVFGDVKVPSTLESFEFSDIDLIFSNIFTDDKKTVIDTEWTFDFPVPVKYVIYRAIRYAFSGSDKLAFLEEHRLYEKYGIPKEHKIIFDNLEGAFQRYIAGDNVSLIGLHSIMGMDNFDIDSLVQNELAIPKKWHVGVFFDNGIGFSQETLVYYKADKIGDDISLRIPLNGVKAVRIDPTELPCMLNITKLEMKGTGEKKVEEILTNGIYLGDGVLFFTKEDPQIIVEKTNGYTELEICYSIPSIKDKYHQALAGKLDTQSGFGFKRKGAYDKVRI